MPYYIELTCRIGDEPKFSFLGLSAIHQSTACIELAGRTNEPDLVGILRSVPVPFRGFRSGNEQTDPAILISDGTDFLSLPTMSGDLRPYAALDQNGLPSAQSIQSALRFYGIAAAVSEALGE
jgi:hypothetical protein